MPVGSRVLSVCPASLPFSPAVELIRHRKESKLPNGNLLLSALVGPYPAPEIHEIHYRSDQQDAGEEKGAGSVPLTSLHKNLQFSQKSISGSAPGVLLLKTTRAEILPSWVLVLPTAMRTSG
jgi:hypothetical protein